LWAIGFDFGFSAGVIGLPPGGEAKPGAIMQITRITLNRQTEAIPGATYVVDAAKVNPPAQGSESDSQGRPLRAETQCLARCYNSAMFRNQPATIVRESFGTFPRPGGRLAFCPRLGAPQTPNVCGALVLKPADGRSVMRFTTDQHRRLKAVCEWANST
jgi:hypothetical protein